MARAVKRFLLERTGAERRVQDPGPPLHGQSQVDLGLGAGADSDHHDPAPEAQRLEVAGHVGRADELEDHVERTVLLEALGGDHVGAELRDPIPVVRIPDSRGHARSGRVGKLDRRRANAAGAAVHEQPLARLQPGLGEHAVVRGRKRLGDTAGLDPPQILRDRHQDPLVDDRELGLAPARDDPHHPIADRKPLRTRTAIDDLAGELEPRDVLRRTRRRGIEAAPLHHVGAVQAGRPYADEHLARAGRRIRMVLDAQVAVSDRDRAHARPGR